MKSIPDVEDNITGNSSTILAKVFIDGHGRSLLSLDRLPVVGSNNN
jgi:hypothetical protein